MIDNHFLACIYFTKRNKKKTPRFRLVSYLSYSLHPYYQNQMPRLNSILLSQFLLLANMLSVAVSCKIGNFNTLIDCLLQNEQQRELTNCKRLCVCVQPISLPPHRSDYARSRATVTGNNIVFIDLWLSLFTKVCNLKTRIKGHSKGGVS